MDGGGDECLDEPKAAAGDLGQRREGLGGSAGVGDDAVLDAGVVVGVVEAGDEGRGVLGRSRDDGLLATGGFDAGLGHAGGLHRVLGPELASPDALQLYPLEDMDDVGVFARLGDDQLPCQRRLRHT